MDIAIISPPKMLELSDLTEPSFGMVLPEGMVLSEDYIRFYRDMDGYKILDNGIVEGRQYTGTELHHMAYEVGANCIVLPDQFRNADATIKMAQDFKRHRNSALEYMGVLQGTNLDEIFACLIYYDSQPWITHIGLPRILFELDGRHTRSVLTRTIRQHKDFRPFKLHALGASNWIGEVKYLAEAGCDSMDTSLPVVMGIQQLNMFEEYVPRQDDFMNVDVDRNSPRWNTLVDNCRTYLQWGNAPVKDSL